MSRVVEVRTCPRHRDQEIGVVIESVVYDGCHDNGEDYSVERDEEFWPCPRCDADFADGLIEGTLSEGF